ncbi:hypothetical protein [Streptomyces lavendulocolor]|uniref:hypothetical protein n=1 Tax=Streptomyces lavendulocolor TaxID=67316 RepID=UPI003C2D7FC6
MRNGTGRGGLDGPGRNPHRITYLKSARGRTNMQVASRLQVDSVEEAGERGGTVIVRCVGGLARVGQTYTLEEGAGSGTGAPHFVLNRIERYPGVFVDVFGPPHAARVHVSGASPASLSRGVVIISKDDGDSIPEE